MGGRRDCRTCKIIGELADEKNIRSLLSNEGMYSDEVCIDYENGLFEPIYGQLKKYICICIEHNYKWGTI